MDSNEISTGVVVASPAPCMEHIPATTTDRTRGGVRPLTGARRGFGYAHTSLPSSGTPILAPPV